MGAQHGTPIVVFSSHLTTSSHTPNSKAHS